MATDSAHNGGFSGYSSPNGLISLCIFRLWVFLVTIDSPNPLHLHNIFRKANLPLRSKKDTQVEFYA